MLIFFVKQKRAYEMRVSDWSSDVCSSDLGDAQFRDLAEGRDRRDVGATGQARAAAVHDARRFPAAQGVRGALSRRGCTPDRTQPLRRGACEPDESGRVRPLHDRTARLDRSEEHTSDLQSLMRNSYAVFCLKKKRT